MEKVVSEIGPGIISVELLKVWLTLFVLCHIV